MSSLNFKGGTESTGVGERKERERYKIYMDLLKQRFSIKDTLYDERHYGFLNKRYQVIQPVSGIDTIPVGPYAPTVHALSFVADQYNKFRDFYIEFSSQSGIQIPSLISGLIPNKSFENFDLSYENHLTTLALQLQGDINLLAQGSRVSADNVLLPLDFYEIINNKILFQPYMMGKHISKSGYALSSKSNVYQTGLYVDLASQLPTNIDLAKGQMIEDPGFLCYLTFASEHGFSVDFNAPWRLIVDLSHEKTIKNVLSGRNTSDFWDFYYDQYVENTGFSYDYNNIREFYETLYKMYYRVYNNLSLSEANALNWPEIYRDLLSVSLSNRHQGLGHFWIETFLLNRAKEVGMVRTFGEFRDDEMIGNVLSHAYSIYGSESRSPTGVIIENPISKGKVGQPDSGVAAFITTICGKFIERKMTKVE